MFSLIPTIPLGITLRDDSAPNIPPYQAGAQDAADCVPAMAFRHYSDLQDEAKYLDGYAAKLAELAGQMALVEYVGDDHPFVNYDDEGGSIEADHDWIRGGC